MSFIDPYLKKIVDFAGALMGLFLLAPIYLLLVLWVWTVAGRPLLHWSRRVGKGNIVFLMPKIRTMREQAPQVASHLLADPQAHLLPGCRWIRGLSLDEIPQLWAVLCGSMSLVGPRPALFNQQDLISARTSKGIHVLLPGITGWAQIVGRDELSVDQKVEMDLFYLKNRNTWLDLIILCRTVSRVIRRKGISH
jgi:O-antigen biosynthesis protein WbqP